MIGGSLSLIFKTNLFGWLLSFSSKKIRSLAAKPKQKDLEFIANLSNDGILKPVIEKYYPLDKTAEAVRYLLEGHAKGKVVIKMQQKIT